MPRRDTVPLYSTRHVAFVEAILEEPNLDKSISSHLSVGLGPRANTICHTHSSWFRYKPDGSLYYKIPGSEPCRKYGDTEPCGDCNRGNNEKYGPKTPASAGREILVKNEWTNPVTNEREYFGLKDAVENYFALNGTHAPDGVQHGHEMIQGKGISIGTLSDWIRDIAAQAEISATLREDRLREVITINEDSSVEQIKDFGTDADGNEIPDIFAHDMRATFATHLMRNDVPRYKAILKTGHKTPESMEPYVKFAEDEINSTEEAMFY